MTADPVLPEYRRCEGGHPCESCQTADHPADVVILYPNGRSQRLCYLACGTLVGLLFKLYADVLPQKGDA